MVSSTCSFFQSFAGNLYPRRLLLHAPLNEPLPIPAAFPVSATVSAKDTSPDRAKQISFDSNIVMILSILLCALIFAVVLNSIIRCARRCSIRAAFESRERAPASQLANAGIDKKALQTFPILAYSTGLNLPECTICLADFVPGERIRVLPKCDHGFHLRCIDKWLTSHTSCPNCRQCLIDTCRKIVRGNESSGSSERVQQVITPLEPESLMINYRSIR